MLVDILEELDLEFTQEHIETNHHNLSRLFNVSISFGGKIFETHFTQGSAITEDPELPMVMECLLSDASTEGDILEFAGEFGFEISTHDQREELRRVHGQCVKTRESLLDMFGEELFSRLQYSDRN